MSKHGIPDSALDKHVAILGKTGSGKSNLAKLIAEDLLARNKRVAVIDPTGVWWGLRLMADGSSAGHSCVIFGGQHGDLPLSASHGEAIAKVVSTTSTPAIIDTRLLSPTDRTRFFTEFAQTIVGSNQGELTLFIDEAHMFMPQAGSGTGKASATMLHAGNNLVSLGRGVGLRIVLISQRPSKLHKDALTQVETLVSMRFISPQDQRAIKEWVEGVSSEGFDPTQLRHLPVGDAWVWYPEEDYLELVHTPLVSTYDSGKVRSQKVPDLPKIDVDEIASLLQHDEEDTGSAETDALRRRISKLERDLRRARKTSVPDEAEINRRVEAVLAADRKRHKKELKGLRDGLSGEIDRFIKKIDDVREVEPKAAGASKESPRQSVRERNGSTTNPVNTRDLNGPQTRVLEAVGWLRDFGIAERASRVQAAFLAGYKPSGGAFNNVVSSLRSRGLLDYPASGFLELTAEGAALVTTKTWPLTTEELHDAVMERLNGPQRKLLRPLIDAFPDSLDVDELARASGYERGGGAFNNTKSSLRSLGIIDYPETGKVVAREVLFLD